MDPISVGVIIAGLLIFAILWRTASSSSDKTPTRPVDPNPYDQSALELLTKNQLIEVAKNLGLEPRVSWTKAKIIQVITIAVEEGTN